MDKTKRKRYRTSQKGVYGVCTRLGGGNFSVWEKRHLLEWQERGEIERARIKDTSRDTSIRRRDLRWEGKPQEESGLRCDKLGVSYIISLVICTPYGSKKKADSRLNQGHRMQKKEKKAKTIDNDVCLGVEQSRAAFDRSTEKAGEQGGSSSRSEFSCLDWKDIPSPTALERRTEGMCRAIRCGIPIPIPRKKNLFVANRHVHPIKY